jgi:hypothetical protein
MHRASFTIASLRLADTAGLPGPPPGISFEHAFWADWKAGDWGSIPELESILIPPPALGSGKFGTPCDRMQAANLIATPAPFEPDPGLAEDPHAVNAIAQPTVVSATARTWRGLRAPMPFVFHMPRVIPGISAPL